MPYLSASGVMIHEEALYQVYVPLALPLSKRYVMAVDTTTIRLEFDAVRRRFDSRSTSNHHQSAGCGFESQHGLLRTKVYSAFHPSGVGK